MAVELQRLKSVLNTSGLQQKDPPLYQVIVNLLDAVQGIQNNVITITGGGGGGGSLANKTYVTVDNELATLPFSRRIVAGAGITFNNDGQRLIVNASLPLDSGGGGEGGEGEQGPPGPQGLQGAAGSPGIMGMAGAMGPPGLDCECEVPDQLIIPGVKGDPGSAGPAGATGPQGIIGPPGPPGEDAEEPLEPLMIPGPIGPQGPQGPAGGGGGGSATIVEVDLGSTPKSEGKFTVTDTTITTTSKISIWQSYGPYTGKGTLADEAAMDRIHCVAVPAAGSAIVYWRSDVGHAFTPIVMGREVRQFVNDIIDPVNQNAYGLGLRAVILGKVKGNFKFAYSVYS